MGRKSNFRQANKEQCGGCSRFDKDTINCDAGLAPFTPRCTDEKILIEKEEAARLKRINELQEIANG